MILLGDVIEQLKTIPDNHIQCCVTSPPYWGLRDYGVVGQIGLEKTPEEYVLKMVKIFQEVWRVMKDDGVLWLNLGDGYIGNSSRTSKREGVYAKNGFGLKTKDLIGMPWRVAFALQNDDWYLRSDIVWSKPNPMPESVTDRPTKSHEYIFLMAKSQKYFYDSEAIKELCVTLENRPDGVHRMAGYDTKYKTPTGLDTGYGGHDKKLGRYPVTHGKHSTQSNKTKGKRMVENVARARKSGAKHDNPFGQYRNKRSVWEISTRAYPEAHFATFPEAIPSICIQAGSKAGDIVLDPFLGSGTTAAVAKRLGRKWIGIELNPAYVSLAHERIDCEIASIL